MSPRRGVVGSPRVARKKGQSDWLPGKKEPTPCEYLQRRKGGGEKGFFAGGKR